MDEVGRSHIIRNFLSKDVLDLFFHYSYMLAKKDNVYNVGSSNMNYSKEEICQAIAEKTNAHVHYAEIGEDADKRNYVVSYKKINDLGFETTIGIHEGIDEIIEALNVVDFRDPYVNVKRMF